MKYFSARGILSIALCFTALMSAPGAMADEVVLHAGHLYAEPGRPVQSRKSIIITDGIITAVKDGYVTGETEIDLKNSWVMPGLIDMHTHVTDIMDLTRPVEGPIALAYMRPQAEQVLSMLPRMKLLLSSGFTTIRNLWDPSSTTYALRDAINAGIVDGPRMYVTEPQVEVDGGDLDPSTKDLQLGLEHIVQNRTDCTGAVECRKVIRREIRRGADVVKFRQSGFATGDANVGMMETKEEIDAIIGTAHELGRKVAVHVDGTPEFLHAAIAAGADTIEHGPLDEKAIELMVQHGTSYTPTLMAAKMIDYRLDDAMKGMNLAYRAGVPVIFGTDLGIISPEQIPDEFGLMVEAGMPPAQVLRAATLNAAMALGQGDRLGSIEAGKVADIIATKSDPLENIKILGDADSVTFVMKEGSIFKQ